MRRCEQLGLDRLNFHPGSHLGQITIEECLRRVAESIRPDARGDAGRHGRDRKHGPSREATSVSPSNIWPPSSNGSKTKAGWASASTPAAQASPPDTTSAARRPATGRSTNWSASVVDSATCRGMHLNDAMKPLGSRVDRHQSLGEGTLGMTVFRCIARDKRFDDMPG